MLRVVELASASGCGGWTQVLERSRPRAGITVPLRDIRVEREDE